MLAGGVDYSGDLAFPLLRAGFGGAVVGPLRVRGMDRRDEDPAGQEALFWQSKASQWENASRTKLEEDLARGGQTWVRELSLQSFAELPLLNFGAYRRYDFHRRLGQVGVHLVVDGEEAQ